MSENDDSSQCWVFDWTSMRVGPLERVEQGWVLRGRPNATPETDWVVAHDVFHHDPEDRGTYAEEVSTFGAEMWMEQTLKGADLHQKLATSWAGVMVMVIENGSRGVEGLRLSGAAKAHELDHPLMSVFSDIYRAALSETKSVFLEYAEEDVWDSLATKQQTARAAALAVRGYLAAAKRWPDPKQAAQWFKQIENLAGQGEDGERLVVRRTGQGVEAQRIPPQPVTRARPRGP